MDSDLNRLFDEITPAPAPSADDLRAIITRSRSRSRLGRVLSLVVVVALAVGLTVAIVRSPPARGVRAAAGPPGPFALAAAVSTPSTPTPSGQAPPIAFAPLLFRTTADKVTIRAHLGTITGPLPCSPGQDCPPPACLPHTILHVGLSTDTVVGEMAVPADGPAPQILALVAPSGFGLPGVASGFTLVFRAGPTVASVHMSFADGGNDEMAPVDGWVILAHVGKSPFGTVEALDANGHVIGSTSIPPAPGPTAGVSSGMPPASPASPACGPATPAAGASR
jgi:hypothetical protein